MRKVILSVILTFVFAGQLSLSSCARDGEQLDRSEDFKDRGFTN